MKLKPIAFFIMAPLAFNAYSVQQAEASSGSAIVLQQTSPNFETIPREERWLPLERRLYLDSDFRRLQSDYEDMRKHYAKLEREGSDAEGRDLMKVRKNLRKTLREADLYQTVATIGETAKYARDIGHSALGQQHELNSRVAQIDQSVGTTKDNFNNFKNKINAKIDHYDIEEPKNAIVRQQLRDDINKNKEKTTILENTVSNNHIFVKNELQKETLGREKNARDIIKANGNVNTLRAEVEEKQSVDDKKFNIAAESRKNLTESLTKTNGKMESLGSQLTQYKSDVKQQFTAATTKRQEIRDQIKTIDDNVRLFNENVGKMNKSYNEEIAKAVHQTNQVEVKVDDVITDVTDLKETAKKFDSIDTQVTGFASRVTTLENGKDEMVTRVDGVKDELAALQNKAKKLDSIDTQVTGFESRVTTLENGKDEMVTRVDGFRDELSAIQDKAEKFDSIDTQVTGFDSRVTTLENKAVEFDNLTENIDIVKDARGKFKKVTGDVTKLAGVVNQNQISTNDRLQNVDKKFNINETERNELRRTSEANGEKIVSLGKVTQSTIETMHKRNKIVDGKFKHAKADRDEIRGETVKNKNQITAIGKDVKINNSYRAKTDLHTKQIDALNNEFDIYDQRLNEQENLTEALQQQFKDFTSEFEAEKKRTNAALAGVTALSMLPQPYSAGRANIAAGVGHYHGETALAIGVGYAVDENLTFRGGISYTKNMKRPAIGAAVGYTF